MKTVLLKLIAFYKVALSPFFGQQCRFYPTCSSYAQEAIEQHGSMHGGWLAVKRLVKCAINVLPRQAGAVALFTARDSISFSQYAGIAKLTF